MSPPLLEMPRALFEEIMQALAKSGSGVRESGAFLLGDQVSGRRRVESYLMYDVVAPVTSRAHNYVALTGQDVGRAWEHCYRAGVQVVADVHTHPFGPGQSISDRGQPIVSITGHVALIVPYFAMRQPCPVDLGVHLFLGDGQWESRFGAQAREALHLTERV